MDFQFAVSVSAERSEGKFETRESIETAIIEALESADPGTVSGDNGTDYEITDWTVDAQEIKPRKAKPATADLATAVRAVTGGLTELIHWEDDSDEGAERFEAKLKLVGRQADGLFLQLLKLGLIKD